ncbi:MAG: cyclic nucleotide-binding domain-containing protein [Clostridia bacterium]|nr:cyclic nucleotide-binding domain-containing protein [Clostridia bacterium]
MTQNSKIIDIRDFGAAAGRSELQTEAIQRALDACAGTGGVVSVPKGVFRTGGLLMHYDTEFHLCAGAALIGSDDCEDYPVFPVPDGVDLRTDMEMITHYYNDRPWKEYRRAILSAYGERNVAVTGEAGAVINGADCFDANGEEGFRGPHGLFFSNCENIRLEGYTIERCGNFMHQIDNSVHIRMRGVTSLAGHDGVHLHCCRDTLIENCAFITGDDCVAGINIRGLTLRGCELNTSCDLFRIGGTDITVEDCHMYGPGKYPHRMTVVRGKNDVLPDHMGRHNLLTVVEYFSSETYPSEVPADRIVFRNCTIENPDRFMHYEYGTHTLQTGTPLTGLTIEDCVISGVLYPSLVKAKADAPLTVTLRRVKATGADGGPIDLFDGQDVNTKIITDDTPAGANTPTGTGSSARLSACEWLAGIGDTEAREFKAGDVIYSPRKYRKALGIVLSGEVIVTRKGDTGVLLNTLKAGDVFGLAALFGAGETASGPCEFATEIRARTNASIRFIPGETVKQQVRTDPEFAENYIRLLSEKVRFLNRRIADFTASDTERKLAGYLAACPADDRGIIRPNRSALARTLDIGRASLYRALDCFESKGLIRKADRGIQIVDREALRALTARETAAI